MRSIPSVGTFFVGGLSLNPFGLDFGDDDDKTGIKCKTCVGNAAGRPGEFMVESSRIQAAWSDRRKPNSCEESFSCFFNTISVDKINFDVVAGNLRFFG